MSGPLPYARFHGTRGSVATPEPANARYGGNTSCVEIGTGDGRVLLLDAGTGIRAAGRALGPLDPAAEVNIFLSHFHWDHVQGLPFFAPLHQPGARIHIYAPCQADLCITDLFNGLLAPLYFPVPFDGFAASISLHPLPPTAVQLAGVEVASMRVQHPSNTHGFRIRYGGRTVAYVPDNELAADAAAFDELCEFVRGADLLIHDAMLTEVEYIKRRGWGHSTIDQAVRLAEAAQVRRLRLFHHAPDRTDTELDAVGARLRRELTARRSELAADLAREGDSVAF